MLRTQWLTVRYATASSLVVCAAAGVVLYMGLVIIKTAYQNAADTIFYITT